MEDSKPGAEMPLLGAYEYSFSTAKFIRFFGPGLLMSIAYIVGTCSTPRPPPPLAAAAAFHSSRTDSQQPCWMCPLHASTMVSAPARNQPAA
jgi:hypothetical protein